MQNSRRLLTVLLLPLAAQASQPWETGEVDWLLKEPARLQREARILLPPEFFAAVQADGNHVEPRHAQGEEAMLLEAVSAQDIQAVKSLLKTGASPNARDYWRDSSLLVAVRADNLELVQVLLDAGAPIEWGDKQQHSPLWWAVYLNQKDTARLLLERGAQQGVMSIGEY